MEFLNIMGLDFSFFRTPKHKFSHYKPRYRTENDEAMEEKHSRLNDEGRGRKNEKAYVPGRHMSGKFRRSTTSERRGSINSSVIIRIVILITILLLFFFAWYVAKSSGLFF